eukprot:874695-Prorocentrum_minimum.AAC.1
MASPAAPPPHPYYMPRVFHKEHIVLSISGGGGFDRRLEPYWRHTMKGMKKTLVTKNCPNHHFRRSTPAFSARWSRITTGQNIRLHAFTKLKMASFTCAHAVAHQSSLSTPSCCCQA